MSTTFVFSREPEREFTVAFIYARDDVESVTSATEPLRRAGVRVMTHSCDSRDEDTVKWLETEYSPIHVIVFAFSSTVWLRNAIQHLWSPERYHTSVALYLGPSLPMDGAHHLGFNTYDLLTWGKTYRELLAGWGHPDRSLAEDRPSDVFRAAPPTLDMGKGFGLPPLDPRDVDLYPLEHSTEGMWADRPSRSASPRSSKTIGRRTSRSPTSGSSNVKKRKDKPTIYPVYFGTNRLVVDGAFTADRDSKTHVGICRVEVPKYHKFGTIKSTWWRRLFSFRDGTLRVKSTRKMPPTVFWKRITSIVNALPPGDQDSVVFVHGYNTDFEEAAIRAAQIGFDLGVRGVMSFFSWPSKGSTLAYKADEATIEASEPYLLDFITDLCRSCPSGRVHVIAHSMGNRALLRSLHTVFKEASASSDLRLGQIILAAPDIDADLFRTLATCYRNACRRATLYVSPRDRAVGLAKWLNEFDRVGFAPPVTVVDGIDTILVPGFDLLDLGHTYFAEAESVLHDMHVVLFYGTEPGRRQRLAEMEAPDGRSSYWELRY